MKYGKETIYVVGLPEMGGMWTPRDIFFENYELACQFLTEKGSSNTSRKECGEKIFPMHVVIALGE